MYDFTTRVDRRGCGSTKWDAMYEANPDVPEGVVPLSVADMEFVEAPEIVAAIRDFAQDAVLGYTHPTPSYYDAVVAWQIERHGWEAKPEWIALAPGVVPAIATALRAFTKPGEGVVIMPPVYHPFRANIETTGRTVVENPLVLTDDGRYEIDFEGLERLCAEPSTTMLILCSPHNPVGRVWTPDELRRVAQICCDNDVFVCCDEIHGDLVMPGFRHTVLATVMPEGKLGNCMVCTAPSKTFNLAGLQCSNIFIPDEGRRNAFVRASREYSSFSCCNAFAYPVCEAAYRSCAGWLDELCAVVAENHRFMADYCSEHLPMLKVFPLEGTYLQWVDCRDLGLDPCALEKFMTDKALLFLDEGKIFGVEGEGFERFNIACPRSVLAEALDRLAKAVKELGDGASDTKATLQ